MTTTLNPKNLTIKEGVFIADTGLSMYEAHRRVRTSKAYQAIRETYPLERFHVKWVGSEIVSGCWHVTFEAELKLST